MKRAIGELLTNCVIGDYPLRFSTSGCTLFEFTKLLLCTPDDLLSAVVCLVQLILPNTRSAPIYLFTRTRCTSDICLLAREQTARLAIWIARETRVRAFPGFVPHSGLGTMQYSTKGLDVRFLRHTFS